MEWDRSILWDILKSMNSPQDEYTFFASAVTLVM